jgi:cell division protein FtsI/penicillin-binding protein 2
LRETGTAENCCKINGKENQTRRSPIFVAFAPKDNPKIASYLGRKRRIRSNNSRTHCSLMIEKYLKKSQELIFEKEF